MTESESIEVLELRGRVQTLEAKLESIEASGGVGIPQTSLLSPNFLARVYSLGPLLCGQPAHRPGYRFALHLPGDAGCAARADPRDEQYELVGGRL